MTDKGLDIVIVGTGAGNARALAGGIGAAEIKHAVQAAPVIHDKRGRAWLCDMAEGCRRLGVPSAENCALAHWVVEAPWAHPAWHSYSLLLMHLRPLPGMPEPKRYMEFATHELILHALNPDMPLDELIATGLIKGQLLTPTNFAAQIVELEDDDARARIRAAVEDICAGKLSPDTDHRRAWEARFGNNMVKREFR